MLKSALFFLYIHLKRLYRMLGQLGIFRVLLLGGILVMGLKATLKPGMLHWQATILVLILAQNHINRKDFVLLNNQGFNHAGFFMLLYLLISSPFLLTYLIWPDFTAALILTGGIALLSLIKKPLVVSRKKNYPAFRFIPADSWEWRAGLRKNYLFIFVLYLLAGLFSGFDYTFAIVLLAFSLLAASFQMTHESQLFILSTSLPPKSFLLRKLLLQIIPFTILSLPLMLGAFILYPDGFRPLLLVFINSLLVQAFTIAFKYAGYLPGTQTPYHMAVIVLLNLTFILPVLIPLPILMLAVYSKKAIVQLTHIIHVQHS